MTFFFSAKIRLASVGIAAGLLGLAASCTYSHGDPAPTCDTTPQAVTYAGVISPIFDAHCRECHATNVASALGGGNDFGNYTAINNYFSPNNLLATIRHTPGADAMPKGRAKLSDCDISRIEAWIANGKPNN